MRWRLITDDRAGAADGLALDEALMAPYARGEHPEQAATLRLYTYRPHCALVGHYQSLEAEIDTDACARLDVEIGRRPTGGGAIIMGPGQLGVAITTQAPAGVGPRSLLARYAEGIVAGLATLGVRAAFRGKNDLTVEGRKVAGLGLYLDPQGGLLFHASVLCDLDVELMLAVLRIPGAKLADKGVSRVQQRITTVQEQAGPAGTTDAVRDALATAFARTLRVTLDPSRPTAEERARATRLVQERYAAAAWLTGRRRPPGARGSAAFKTPGGLVRVYAGVQRDALSSVMFAGDFSVMPPELLALEGALRWCHAGPERIQEIIASHVPDGLLGVSAAELSAGVWGAA
ncbi:MAG TPA: biotin/lipoate A/B protein ligase family protein, partial [Solirubrobacteraceae bacterium]|nr:biotin/lipoate A/B protein ligase family protein [Solirubrobacteraceae bacterium]